VINVQKLECVVSDKRIKAHPSTPNKNMNYTRRGWDMLIKIWRKKLHYWDPKRYMLIVVILQYIAL